MEEFSALSKITALQYFIEKATDEKLSSTSFDPMAGKITEQEARRSLGALGLTGKTVSETPLNALSGGQKVRLALALILFRPPNLL